MSLKIFKTNFLKIINQWIWSFCVILNLRNNLRKSKGVRENLRFYLRKTKGGREGVWSCFSEGKTKRTWGISLRSLSEESKKKYEVLASYSFLYSSICIRGQASCAESVFGYKFQKKILNQLKPPKNDLIEIKYIIQAIFYN